MIKIIDKKDCCGCTACANVCTHKAISMEPDVMGFMYPKVNTELCTNCGLCDKVCQFNKVYNRLNRYDKPIVFGCRHKDTKELLLSQSGAASWTIIQLFLEQPGVVYGVGYESPNYILHKRATTIEECAEFRGSKYVQSDIRGIFQQIKNDLKTGNRVLFIGTPCQVAGLRGYIPNNIQDNLLLVDVVCHATPSPAVWKSYLKYLENKYHSKIINTNFRDKQYGWRAHIETCDFANGVQYSGFYFRELFYNHLIVRNSCTNCHFTNFKRVSDITISDFWGWEKYHEEWNDNQGVSLFLVNSDKGKEIQEELSGKYMDFIKSDISECTQPQLQSPIKENPEAKIVEKIFAQKGYKGVARYCGFIGFKYHKARLYAHLNGIKSRLSRIKRVFLK